MYAMLNPANFISLRRAGVLKDELFCEDNQIVYVNVSEVKYNPM